MKVAYLGPKSSFSHQAARKQFVSEELLALPTIPNCLQAVQNDLTDIAVVPVENSLEGSVHATIDTLSNADDLTIQREIVLPIRQQLLAHQAGAFAKILSHPQALAQSQHFLEEQFPGTELVAMSSTTAAAKYVQQHSDEKVAAIASAESAAEYDLAIVAKDIQDNDLNQTRFWIIGKKEATADLPAPEKQTLTLILPSNQPGALHKMLAAFGWREINLSKIESRPLKTSLGQYFFVIDLLLDRPAPLIENALEEIRLLGGIIHDLGKYPVRVCQ